MRVSAAALSALTFLLAGACNGAQNGHGAPPTTEQTAPASSQAAPAQSVPRAQQPVGSDWRPFSDDSPWNAKIPADARIDANSADLIRELASFNALHINVELWSVPVYDIDMARTPMREVRSLYSGSMGRGFESGVRVPVPDEAQPARPEGGTGYISIVDRARGLAWEMNQMGRYPNGNLFAGFGALTDLRGTGVATPWMQAENPGWAAGARPSGVPLIAGLLRPESVRQGRIDHALAFAYPGARTSAFVPPASIARTPGDNGSANPFGLPFGARIQLDPAFDVEATDLSPAGKAIARALQEYGAILVDEAGGLTLFADSSPEAVEAWQGLMTSEELHRVFHPGMMAANFRVLEIGDPLPGPPVQPR